MELPGDESNSLALFQESLNLEYQRYSTFDFSNFGSTGKYLSSHSPEGNLDGKTKYLCLLDRSFQVYQSIVARCHKSLTKTEIKALRNDLNETISFNQNIFGRLHWVVQDCIWYALSKLNPEMHRVNQFFIEFFRENRNMKTGYEPLPHHRIFQYSSTPSSSWFKDTIGDYIQKNADEIDNTSMFYIFLFDKSLTEFGRSHIFQVLEIFDRKLEEFYDLNGESLLKHYLNYYKVRNLERMSKFREAVRSLTRNSENDLRERKTLPRVGEGWIEETNLYQLVKARFPNRRVIHHGRPEFLGRQHLDIWIPSLNTGIEYQGEQHYRPVEYFGGAKTFAEQQERDKKKLQLCEENGVKLIYVQKGYDIENVLCLIERSRVTAG